MNLDEIAHPITVDGTPYLVFDKQQIKSLMLELIEDCKTASTEGGVHKVATYELRKKVEAL
jgi:formate dehydrogenase assembly factor FdhD